MSTNKPFSWNLYDQAPVVGIIRGLDYQTIRKITQVYVDAGFYTLEITMNTGGATETIAALMDEFPDFNVGAGTVCSLTDLNNALAAGSKFIVTPIVDEDVIKTCVNQGIPIFPGAYTPSEIYKAWSWGASAVKLFPATQLGVQFIKDVLAPLDQIKLLPTGGVTRQNIKTFFEAGAMGVGMGSSLFDKKMIEAGDFEGLKSHFEAIKSEILDYIK